MAAVQRGSEGAGAGPQSTYRLSLEYHPQSRGTLRVPVAMGNTGTSLHFAELVQCGMAGSTATTLFLPLHYL